MRAMLTIAWLQFRLAFQSPARVLLMFAMPLAFVGVLLLVTGTGRSPKPVPLAVVDADGSFAAGQLVRALQADGVLKVLPVVPSQLDRILADRTAAAGLVIPAGYERGLAEAGTPELQLVAVPGSNPQQSLGLTVARAADAVAANYRLALRFAGDGGGVAAAYARAAADRATIVVEQDRGAAGGGESPAPAGWAVGFTVMFVVMMILVQGGAVRQERETGTWARIRTAPASLPAVLGGYLAGTVIVGLVQFVGLILLFHLLFRIDWGSPLPLAAMALAIVLAAAGLGLFLAAVVQTPEQHRVVAMLVAIVSAMIGGVYSPLDQLSVAMRRVGHLTLQAWAIDGLRAIVFRGGPWSALTAPLSVLTAAALAFTFGGVWRLRRI